MRNAKWAVLLAVLTMGAVQGGSLRDALTMGRTQDQALYDAFNAGYQLSVSGVIARAEVITEFRRAVMIVREHANQGEYGLTERDLAAALEPYRGLVTIIVEARLHPLNTLIKPPAYNLYVSTGPSTKPLPPSKFDRQPIYAVPFASPGTPLTGVHLEGTFAVADVTSAADPHVVVLDDKGDVLWNARLDLSRFR